MKKSQLYLIIFTLVTNALIFKYIKKLEKKIMNVLKIGRNTI